ncbi:hypothetical protein RD792_007945 [Penstemon davidsonii]|uniref:Pentatricopeptide repeat-containing protein n=1 Tax=Penstemon davidsonii TaxID=160366 RepID=A0ABR0D7P0_9LAMI|nr:hypothetical protein RD792_007945 [Penstemon davidsonii]
MANKDSLRITHLKQPAIIRSDSKYKINPSKENNGCMIDLLCRSGRLREAENMIKSMPYKRDDVVWSTLLRASREQGDVECGITAAEEIL